MMMGSTPAQIYRLTKAGQNVGEAGATQFTRFIVYQFGLVAWGAILLLARMPFFAERYGDMTLLCVFSFGGLCRGVDAQDRHARRTLYYQLARAHGRFRY